MGFCKLVGSEPVLEFFLQLLRQCLAIVRRSSVPTYVVCRSLEVVTP